MGTVSSSSLSGYVNAVLTLCCDPLWILPSTRLCWWAASTIHSHKSWLLSLIYSKGIIMDEGVVLTGAVNIVVVITSCLLFVAFYKGIIKTTLHTYKSNWDKAVQHNESLCNSINTFPFPPKPKTVITSIDFVANQHAAYL